MRLTPGQFKEMVASLRAPAQPGDRRKTARLQIQATALVAPLTNQRQDEEFTMLAKDISLEGIGLISSVSLEQGRQILIHLNSDGDEGTYVLCTVMHRSPMADGIYSHGMQFDRLVKCGKNELTSVPGLAETIFEAVLT